MPTPQWITLWQLTKFTVYFSYMYCIFITIIQVYLCNLNLFFFFSGIITFSEYLFLLTILMSKLDWNYVQSPMYFSMKLLWSITEFNWLLLDLYGGPKLGRILKGRGREGKWFLPSITPSTYTHGQLIFGDLPWLLLRKNGIINCVSWIWIAKP